MNPKSHTSVEEDHIPDLALHDQIKCRAYELYEQRDTADGYDLKGRLQGELPRMLYAAAEVEKYVKGELEVTRSVRAARVYLCALSSFIGEHDRN